MGREGPPGTVIKPVQDTHLDIHTGLRSRALANSMSHISCCGGAST